MAEGRFPAVQPAESQHLQLPGPITIVRSVLGDCSRVANERAKFPTKTCKIPKLQIHPGEKIQMREYGIETIDSISAIFQQNCRSELARDKAPYLAQPNHISSKTNPTISYLFTLLHPKMPRKNLQSFANKLQTISVICTRSICNVGISGVVGIGVEGCRRG